MVLDARLKQLATGISAAKAARAFARRLDAKEVLSSLEQEQAAEFEATLEGMFLMAAVDGEVSEEELGQLGASVEAIMDAHAMEGLRLQPLLDDLNRKLSAEGWKARLDAVARRLPTDDAKAFAFRLAAGVAFVDDDVEHAEAAAIDAFAAAMGLAPEASQEILREVVDELFGE
ncbi:MAG: tellurite resistance TerB family protein [Sorangiineae bacterium]|nr:tellurite resistance TerB family protein [Polyangiaceae bacterium]MEB2323834.1 tellurite resistance TerB family protein [Sorangiineae bacterium]